MSSNQQINRDSDEGELFRLLVENVKDYAIFVLDPQGRVQSWNPGAERMLGYRTDEVIAQPLTIFFTPEDVQAGIPEREMRDALEGGRGNDDRWQVRKDGTRFWAGGSMTPLWDADRELRGFAKIMRDRTEWKRAEDEQKKRTRATERLHRLYEAVLSNTPDLVYVFDLNHRFTYANNGLLAMWGRSWEEAIGKNCLELGYEPWHAAMHDREIDQVIATKQPIKGEVPFTGTFGRRIYEYIFVPVLAENGDVEAVAGTTRDVTERRLAEEQVRHSERFHRVIAELSTDYAFDGTIGSDGTVNIERVTEGFSKFYGMTLEQMNAKGGWASVIHPDDHPRVAQTIERLVTGMTDRGVLRGICQDGSIKWQSYLAVPIQEPETGRTVGLYGAATDVTAQQALTEQLREQADSLSAILSATVDNIYLVDKEGRFRYVSRGGANVFGLAAEAMTGQHWRDLGLPAQVMEQFDVQRTKAIASGTPQRSEVGFTDKAGQIHHYDYSVAPVKNSSEEFDAVVVVSRDDTERKRAEEALREASATLHSFYETAPVMMGVVEVEGDDVIHLTDNAATYRFFDALPGSLTHRRASELGIPAEHLREWVRRYRESQRTCQPVRFEYQHHTPQGWRWLSAIVYCIESLSEGRCRCSYVAEDVTERKRVEEALREAEQRWRNLAEALPNLVWTDLPDGRCDYLSSQWRTYTGVPEEELLGLNWLERVIHPDDRQRTLTCWLTAVADKGSYDLEYRIRRHDGEYRWFKTRGVPIRDEQGQIVKWFGTCTDIEDEKRAVEALSAADRRKDEFLATLAHELRNPLAPIRNSLEILKMPRVDAAMVQQTRDMMDRQVHQLTRLVDDLLDVSRVMRGKIELRRERLELATVVARAVETAQPLIEMQQHRLEISLPSESLPLDADAVRLAQAVSNLLTNAAKYTEANGCIRLSARRGGDEVILTIQDDGIGIAPDMLPHIFDLFVQADHASTKAQGGLGIGLTLVRNLVEMHGGTVEAHSDGLGQGSTFVIRLPLMTQPTPSADKEAAAGSQPGKATGCRLMVVDDNQDAATSLAMLLRLQGHEVQIAHDGPTALQMAIAFRPDVIFLDIGMPGMDGYEVARQIRTTAGLEKTVLAALTGWGQEQDRQRTAEAGFDHHLVKPPEIPTLISLIAGLRHDDE